MADLTDGQFELDGYVFGLPSDPVIIMSDGFDSGAPDARTNDIANPVGDGDLFGRDYLSGPTWAFSLGVLDDENVYTALGDLARVWRNEAIRKTPGALSTLRFRRNGETYRVYGRPRRFGLVPDTVHDDEFRLVEADFKVDKPIMYVDEPESVTLALGAAVPDDGLVLPETLEWTLGESFATANAVLNLQSLDPAPFEVTVQGPSTGALSQVTLEGPGWAIDVQAVVGAHKTLHIDTRRMTADIDGVSVAGSLTRRSRLNARLMSGASSVSFTATDPSGTSTATFSWRGTTPIL